MSLTKAELTEARDLLSRLGVLLDKAGFAETPQPPSPEPPPAPTGLPPATLMPADYQWASTALSCDIAAVEAVCAVESNGHGFAPDGRPIILFEPHIFSRLTQHRFDDSRGGVSYRKWGTKPYPKTQAERWAQLEYAANLDSDAAYQSASYGLFQIMGFNFELAGFKSVDAFVHAMHESERAHLGAFVDFLKNRNLVGYLRDHSWLAFATGYNGTGQAAAYAAKLKAAYERFK